jgi:hypothetical protein
MNRLLNRKVNRKPKQMVQTTWDGERTMLAPAVIRRELQPWQVTTKHPDP